MIEERYCAEALFIHRPSKAACCPDGVTFVAIKAPPGTVVYAPRTGELSLGGSSFVFDASGNSVGIGENVDHYYLDVKQVGLIFHEAGAEPRDWKVEVGDEIGVLDDVTFSPIGDYNLLITASIQKDGVFLDDAATLQAMFSSASSTAALREASSQVK